MLLSDPFASSSLRGAILSGTLVSIVSVRSFPRVGQRVGQRPPRASHCSSGVTGLLPVCLTPVSYTHLDVDKRQDVPVRYQPFDRCKLAMMKMLLR